MAAEEGHSSPTCADCGKSLVPLPTMHVERTCTTCNRQTFLAEPGEDGEGIRVEKGDRFHIPAGALRISLDPRQGSGSFTRDGISWFVQHLYMSGLPNDPGTIGEFFSQLTIQTDEVLKKSELLADLDLEDDAQAALAAERIKQRQETVEFWAMMVGAFVSVVQDDLSAGRINEAVQNSLRLASARAMLIYKQGLEEVVWHGHRVSILRRVLDVWNKHHDNASEEFWQQTISANAFVLSQVFSYPVLIVRGKAFVGGKAIDNAGGKVLDFPLKNNLTDNVALLEIKTPTTKLLGPEYRNGVYSIGSEVSGAIGQVAGYRDSLLKNYFALRHESSSDFEAFSPKCVVLAGNLGAQFASQAERRSFELFRNELSHVTIVSFDELFAKVRVLLELLEGK